MGLFDKGSKFDEEQLNKMISSSVQAAFKEQAMQNEKSKSWWEKHGETVVSCGLTALIAIIGSTF